MKQLKRGPFQPNASARKIKMKTIKPLLGNQKRKIVRRFVAEPWHGKSGIGGLTNRAQSCQFNLLLL
jgi:hypothetical protein